MVGYLVVDVELVVDGDLEAGAVEDVQRFWQQGQLESGCGSQKNAATPSLGHTVVASLKISRHLVAIYKL